MNRTAGTPPPQRPVFDEDFRARLEELLIWRRDVRHFRTDPLDEETVMALIDSCRLAPSVGNAQPWRFVLIETRAMRERMLANFERCNEAALKGYDGEQARLYSQLKLSGMRDAPVQMAVFTDTEPAAGHGLGRQTMPETLHYSTVCAIYTMWLSARARDLGIGWVSIIDPAGVERDLGTPPSWRLTAYLCIGHPEYMDDEPELVRRDWQQRLDIRQQILRR